VKKSSIAVEQNKDRPIENSVLAKAIVDISLAMKKLSSSGLTRHAIIVLVANSTREYQSTVDRVLTALEDLKEKYCQPVKD